MSLSTARSRVTRLVEEGPLEGIIRVNPYTFGLVAPAEIDVADSCPPRG